MAADMPLASMYGVMLGFSVCLYANTHLRYPSSRLAMARLASYCARTALICLDVSI